MLAIRSFFVLLVTILFSLQTAQTILASSLILLVSCVGFYDYKVNSSYVLVFGGLSVLIVSAILFRPGSFNSIAYYFIFCISIVSAYLYRFKMRPDKLHVVLSVVFYSWTVLLFFIIIRGVIGGQRYVFEGLIPGVSTNGIPAFYLIITVAYLSSVFRVSKKLPVVPTVLCLIVAYYGIGRGGILVAFLLFCFYSCRWISSSVLKVLFFVIVTVGFGLFYAGEIVSYYDFFVASTKLSVGLSDPARAAILTDYLESLDVLSIFVGGDLDGSVAEKLYGGNLHISFLRSHNLFGLAYLAFVFISPFIVLIRREFSFEIFFYFFMLLIIWLRALTEPNVFPTVLDLFYFIVLFMALGEDEDVRYA